MAGFHAAGVMPYGALTLVGFEQGSVVANESADTLFASMQLYVSFLTVEDGSIVANANTLIDIPFADAHALRTGRHDTWSILSPAAKERAIIRAMNKIDAYETRLLGIRTSVLQTLSWPRADMFALDRLIPWNEVPDRVKRAQAEAAIREGEANNSTMPDEVPTATGRITREVKQVGSIKKEVEYEEGFSLGSGSLQPYYPVIDSLMSPFFADAFSLIHH